MKSSPPCTIGLEMWLEIHTHTQTNKHTDIHTNIQTHAHHTYKYTYIHIYIYTMCNWGMQTADCVTHSLDTVWHIAPHCSKLQHTATLQHTHWRLSGTRQHTATHCNTLQHTATHCNILQHAATH